MPAPAPPMLEKIVRCHTSLDEIDEFIAQLPIPREHRSALWLWARFNPPPEHSGSGHDELERRLCDQKLVLPPHAARGCGSQSK